MSEIPDDVVIQSFESARAVLAQSSNMTVIDAMRAAGSVFAEWALEEAAKACEPSSPRPCDCDHCICGNSGDAQSVAAWDEATANAAAIRARSKGGR